VGALFIAALMQNGELQSHSFILGATHPLLGMDHMSVMIAI
jgi:hydrogenase/urease accessory protein HupE